jgi:hypothetical protein
MLMLGAYWVQAYFEERLNLGRKGLILEKKRWQEKQHVQGKETCKRRNMQGTHAGNPNHYRFRVLV